jgi:hypothetical protein
MLRQIPVENRFRTAWTAQDYNIFQRQAEAGLQLGVIEVEEPDADAVLARIVLSPNKSSNEARPRRGKAP